MVTLATPRLIWVLSPIPANDSNLITTKASLNHSLESDLKPNMYPEARHRAAVMTMERISTQTAIARSMKTACSFVWVRISDLMTRMKFT